MLWLRECIADACTCFRCGGTRHIARNCTTARLPENLTSGSGYGGSSSSGTQNLVQRQPQYSSEASGSCAQGNRVGCNNQGARTRGGRSGGSG